MIVDKITVLNENRERVHVRWTAKHGNEIDLIGQLNVAFGHSRRSARYFAQEIYNKDRIGYGILSMQGKKSNNATTKEALAHSNRQCQEEKTVSGNKSLSSSMFAASTGCPINKASIKKLLVGAAYDFNSQFLNLIGFSIFISFIWCII